jgi:hypothetical protein
MARFVTQTKYYVGDKITEDDRVGEKRNVMQILSGKREVKAPLSRKKHRLRDNIKRDLK